MTKSSIVIVVVLAIFPTIATADDCPAVVTAAARKAFPDATIKTCKPEKKSTGFSVKMEKKDKSLVELDISAKGEVEQIEEAIPTSAVPAVVAKAFAARYPKMTIAKAEKQTKADKSVSYELGFVDNGKPREATFKADGTFVEEE